MANMDIGTPKFFPDLIGYHRGRGSAIGTVAATDSGAYKIGVGPDVDTEDELFDLRPLNLVNFDTSADTDGHVLVNVIFTTASYKQNYIAILNHNLVTAVGKIRIFAGNSLSDITTIDGDDDSDADFSNITTTEVVNADTLTLGADDESVVIEPGTDGTTIIAFTEQDFRYWAVQFEGNTTNTGNAKNGTWGSTDLTVGGIMIGEAYQMAVSSDMSLKRSIVYDKVDILESAGGQRYANATSLGRTASATSKSPFALGTYGQNVHGGRLTYDMNFSYLASTDVMPDEYASLDYDDDQVVGDVWNMTDGPMRPFIFSVDKDSTGNNAESEMIFARFAQNSLDMEQVAFKLWNCSLKIEEEF